MGQTGFSTAVFGRNATVGFDAHDVDVLDAEVDDVPGCPDVQAWLVPTRRPSGDLDSVASAPAIWMLGGMLIRR